MARRLKLLVTSFLLASFVFLALVQVAQPLRSMTTDPDSRLSLPHRSLTNHIALEAPTSEPALPMPGELGPVDIEAKSASTSVTAARPEYVYIPLGPFWAGRILRRVVSSEPDGH